MRISLEDLAARVAIKASLRKAGKERWRYVGLCPFHSEKTPSFYVYRSNRDGRARWQCFGCGADGDATDWLRRMDGETCRAEPDAERARVRQGLQKQEEMLHQDHNRHRDCVIPDDFLQ